MKDRGVVWSFVIVSLLFVSFMAFERWKETPIHFLLTGKVVMVQGAAYYIGEHLAIITLCGIIYKIHRVLPVFIFIAWQVLDMVDFCLTGNEIWFHVGFIPVSMNTAGLLVFCISAFQYLTDEH